jgi:hypothetical protein
MREERERERERKRENRKEGRKERKKGRKKDKRSEGRGLGLSHWEADLGVVNVANWWMFPDWWVLSHRAGQMMYI